MMWNQNKSDDQSTPQPTPPQPDAGADAGADESQLVEQARFDPQAFGELYERYKERIQSYIARRVGNQEDSEDLTANTFANAYAKLDSYEDRGLPFAAWLYRIAHNLVANWHRDNQKRRALPLDNAWSQLDRLIEEGDTPQETVEREEAESALWDAIGRLPEDRRQLVVYKLQSRLSNLEIGKTMQKSESAIKSLYFRTLAALKEDLQSKGWGKGNGE